MGRGLYQCQASLRLVNIQNQRTQLPEGINFNIDYIKFLNCNHINIEVG